MGPIEMPVGSTMLNGDPYMYYADTAASGDSLTSTESEFTTYSRTTSMSMLDDDPYVLHDNVTTYQPTMTTPLLPSMTLLDKSWPPTWPAAFCKSNTTFVNQVTRASPWYKDCLQMRRKVRRGAVWNVISKYGQRRLASYKTCAWGVEIRTYSFLGRAVVSIGE
ncbi:hypothetical protein QBC35DRAFT_454910 [Podospora australis]|uniref:Ecp2 effector protein-like domain-containing protein n=1 Tax=Podospora australis TaxID=1536484 RepID=A0AAN6WMH5_9PEZI|nr:hypothetical protein QBC35DRAFT_454910 [Podospora australis]